MKSLPLYKQIVADIIESIKKGELRPGDRVFSERELSEKYNVSQITSKNALIELADKGYITRIKGKGSFVSTKEELFNNLNIKLNTYTSSKLIGLIMPSLKTKIDLEILKHTEQYLSEIGWELVVKNTQESQEKEKEALKQLRAKGISGLIIFPAENELYNDEFLKLSIDNFPFTFIDRYLIGVKSHKVISDNYASTKSAVGNMIKKTNNQIVFITPDSSNTVTQERLSGFKDAFSEQKAVLHSDFIFKLDMRITSSNDKFNTIYHYLNQLENFTGIFCANNEMALLVYYVLKKHFPHKLNNVQLVTFDEIYLPEFSYIQQDTKSICKHAVESVMKQIEGEPTAESIVVPCKFVSCFEEKFQ